jgi:uncharacterized protein
MPPAGKPFLTAEWRHLAMLNFAVDPAVLQPLVPRGTELDVWQGRTLMSLVGFLFLNARVWGLAIPWHRNFEEVNLRFYVRRKAPEGWRRGVVFVKELVPRSAIAWVARTLYNENYQAVPMRHRVEHDDNAADVRSVTYLWSLQRENQLRVMADVVIPQAESGGVGDKSAIWTVEPETEAQFITEHYWGYSRQRDGGTLEYYVEHPPWRIWPVHEHTLVCDAAALYGKQFAEPLSREPTSALLAEGSKVRVYRGQRLTE